MDLGRKYSSKTDSDGDSWINSMRLFIYKGRKHRDKIFIFCTRLEKNEEKKKESTHNYLKKHQYMDKDVNMYNFAWTCIMRICHLFAWRYICSDVSKKVRSRAVSILRTCFRARIMNIWYAEILNFMILM